MRVVLATMTLKPEVAAALRPIAGDNLVVADDEPTSIECLSAADALIVSDNAYTPSLAAAICTAPRLRWMQIATAGYDNATRLGTPRSAVITSVGDAFSPSVAVHAVALMLALQRGIARMVECKPRRLWDKTLAGTLSMPEGKTILIFGYGSIGHEIAKLVTPLGMKVIGVNRKAQPHHLAAEVHPVESLHHLLPAADVLVVAAPLRPQTEGIIGARELALLKPAAIVVNISRGKLIDTAALLDSLKSGRLAGAGLDVTEPEPLPADHPLWEAPNLIVSPHVAGAAGPYGTERQIERVSANLRRYLAGEPVQYVVTP